MQLRRLNARLLCSAVSVVACAAAAGSTALGSSRAADPLARLAIWQGQWREVVVTKKTRYSLASSVPSHVSCSWTPDHGYMLCEYARDRGDPKQLLAADHLSIFTYDTVSRSYKHLGVSKSYKTLEEAASIDGNVWRYDYQLPDSGGKVLDLRDSYRFVDSNERITRTEISSDGGRHWILLSQSIAHRVE
ncbi:MAG: hypothetical protein ACYDAE_08840 [Steroidobacteraceae bacterium]